MFIASLYVGKIIETLFVFTNNILYIVFMIKMVKKLANKD